MNSMKPDIIVTSALPYANGPIHIGHLVEYIQTDIYVRFLKLSGKRALYCCADDTHGTPIEINAAKEGVSPEEFVERWHKKHLEDFKRYHISFDSYHSTNSKENKELVYSIFSSLQEGGHIYEHEIEQLYSEKDGRFLPDRFVKGTCPKCGSPDQYGDVCEKCGATYKPTELINPRSVLSGDAPVLRKSKHLFFRLSKFSGWLKEWLTKKDSLQPEVKNQMLGWIEKGLEDWCISRDEPYFGFKIPNTDKYFYVWLDAPIGYISSLAHLLGDVESAEHIWNNSEVFHFIGKDIMYFHLLFWPAVLHAAGWKAPDNFVVHGFLTVKGEKMSKSRGTFLTAEEFANKISDTELLRFYYGINLSRVMSDVDFNPHDFKERVNKELVGNAANFIYRTLSFVKKNYDSRLGLRASDEAAKDLEVEVLKIEKRILAHYEECEFRKAVQEILRLADFGNKYFQGAEPWKHKDASQPVLTTCANLVKDLGILLAPIMPHFSETIWKQLNLKDLNFGDLGFSLENHEIGEPSIIYRPIEDLGFEKQNGESLNVKNKSKNHNRETSDSGSDRSTDSPLYPRLIVAKIIKVEKHPKADKLYIEHLDDGSGKERVIVSGLVPYYSADELLGKHIILVDNLKPAKLRGVVSQGMLLAAESKEEGLLEVLEADAPPGTSVLIEGIESFKQDEDFKQGREEISIDKFFNLDFRVKENRVMCGDKVLTIGGSPLRTKKVKKGEVS